MAGDCGEGTGRPAELTLDEAANFLYPKMTREQLEALARVLPKRLHPVGVKQAAGPGRPARTYDADVLAELHADLVRGGWI